MRIALFSVIAIAAATVACAPPPREADAPKPPKPASIACPAVRGADAAKIFGVDARTAARVEQVLQLSGELAATARALDEQTRELCRTVAQDLDAAPLPSGPHPCAVAKERFQAFTRRLPAGAKLEVGVRGVSCGVPRRALEECAGECLTGRPGITSAVSCASDTSCSLDATFPNASAACAARCSARALVLSACTADVDVRVAGTEEVVPALDALRRDLPRLVALGAELAPKVARSAKQATSLVDDVATTVDGLTASGDRTDRKVVTAAVLASCLAPELAETLRAGASLQSSVEGALALHQTVVSR